MRKEVESTEEAFFCDVCKNEISDASWAYGGYASAYEETKACSVCGRDTCEKCRKYFATILSSTSTFHESKCICLECLDLNKELLGQIEQLKKDYRTASGLLQKRYLASERALGNLRKATSKVSP